MAADLDYYIHIPSDPLFNIEIHRQFSHSLVFIPIGAFIVTSVMWWFFRTKISYKQAYLFSFLGFSTAGLLDTFTSYGTQLLWPFIETRFAWNLVSVVDPVITAGLLLFAGMAFYKKEKKYSVWAIGWLTFFLLFGWVQHQRAATAAKSLAEQRGHTIDELVVKPTIANQRLWRATYISGDTIYTDAFRTGIISGIDIYEGESASRIIIEEQFADFENTTLYSDLRRFKKLSENFMIRHPEKPNVIGDARYSMLPTELIPLWGVVVDPSNPDAHLSFRYYRDASEEVRQSFTDMLLGR